MKVLLYFENYNLITKSGIGRALRLQMDALSKNNIKYTLDPSDTYDIAHINTYWDKSYKVLKKCKEKGIPVIVHGHSIVEDMEGSFSCWQIANLYTKPHILKMYRNADYIISPTKFSSDVIRNYEGVKCEVTPLSNGITLDEYAYNEEKIAKYRGFFNITPSQKVVIGVGIPFKRKGFFDFIELAKRNSDITFIWFGGLKSILLPKKNVYAMHHLPKNMIMPGYIDGDIIKGAFMDSKLVFFPSLLETEGIVVLEALAAKTPLLVRDIPVYEDWLTNNVDCYKGKNNDEFDKIIKEVTSKEKDKKLVKKGYDVVKERDTKVIGEKLKIIYESLLKKEDK